MASDIKVRFSVKPLTIPSQTSSKSEWDMRRNCLSAWICESNILGKGPLIGCGSWGNCEGTAFAPTCTDPS